MTYVMSDLHGCKEHFEKMLQKIRFSDQDTLYILGDVIDRGEQGIQILLDLMKRENVHLLMGNHEYIMVLMITEMQKLLRDGKPLDEGITEGLQLWFSDGGEATLNAYLALEGSDAAAMLRFLRKRPLYAEVEVSGQRYVMVHSGISGFTPERAMESYRPEEVLFFRDHPKTGYFSDRTVMVGHTPTFYYGEKHTGRILKKYGIFHMDCGCVYPQSGVLGCLRLEDLAAFYVKIDRV